MVINLKLNVPRKFYNKIRAAKTPNACALLLTMGFETNKSIVN